MTRAQMKLTRAACDARLEPRILYAPPADHVPRKLRRASRAATRRLYAKRLFRERYFVEHLLPVEGGVVQVVLVPRVALGSLARSMVRRKVFVR